MQASPAAKPHVSRTDYLTVRAREDASCAAFATKWGVEAVGRDHPLFLSRARSALAGEWCVIRKGIRCKPNAAQARQLNRVGSYGVHAIGPIYAAEASADVTLQHGGKPCRSDQPS